MNPETDPHRYTEFWGGFLTNEQNQLNGGEIIFSTNGARSVEHP